jgi:hypothetical protein
LASVARCAGRVQRRERVRQAIHPSPVPMRADPARNAAGTADGGLRLRFVLRDRDGKFCRGFDDVFRAEGAEVLVTPV